MDRTFQISAMAALAVTAIAITVPSASARDLIPVKLDEALLVKLPERVATIIIGNPLIVDATLQSGGFMVMTGKSFGDTNIIALDRKGQILMERTVVVQGLTAGVTVFRGTRRETYSCVTNCEPRISLGDSAAFFEGVMAQAAARSARAESATAVSGTVVETGSGGGGVTGGSNAGMNINIQLGPSTPRGPN